MKFVLHGGDFAGTYDTDAGPFDSDKTVTDALVGYWKRGFRAGSSVWFSCGEGDAFDVISYYEVIRRWSGGMDLRHNPVESARRSTGVERPPWEQQSRWP